MPINPIHVLMVEDDAEDVMLTKEALSSSKVALDLRVVEDGAQAMAYLRLEPPYANEPRPDLILLDLNLPKKDGFSVLKTIKSNQELKMLPVIVLTTSTNPDDIHRCYSEYANCYIKKPSDLQEFLKIIRNIKALWLDTAILPSLN